MIKRSMYICPNQQNGEKMYQTMLKDLPFFYKFSLNQFVRSIQGQNLPSFWKTEKQYKYFHQLEEKIHLICPSILTSISEFSVNIIHCWKEIWVRNLL